MLLSHDCVNVHGTNLTKLANVYNTINYLKNTQNAPYHFPLTAIDEVDIYELTQQSQSLQY